MTRTKTQRVTQELKFNSSSLLEFMVLKMISNKALSLREIADHLRSVGWKTAMGSLYPLWTRFRRGSYITSGFEESETGTALKTFTVTENGKQRLKDLRSDWNRLTALIASL